MNANTRFDRITRGTAYDRLYWDFERYRPIGIVECLRYLIQDKVWVGIRSHYQNGQEVRRVRSREFATRQKVLAWFYRQRMHDEC